MPAHGAGEVRGEAERGSPEAPGHHGVREKAMGGQRFQRGKAQGGGGGGTGPGARLAMVASPYPWETTGTPLPLCWPGFELAALGSRTVASLCLAGSLGPAYQSPDQAQATASQIPQQSKGGRREKRRLTRRGARGDASVCGGGSSLWLRGARGDPASVRSPTQILPRQ